MLWWIRSIVACLLAIVCWNDIKYKRIPNGLACGFLLPALLSAFCQPGIGWASRLTGLFAVSLPMALASAFLPGSFGGGDIKLMAACGLLLGFEGILLAAWIGVVAGGCALLPLLAAGRIGKGDHIAFGPFLAIGIWVSLLYGDELLSWYLGMC